jgi:hypothetical protein
MKDLESGKAPKNLQVPSASAGRGRGMTMPAWMMKKMYDL